MNDVIITIVVDLANGNYMSLAVAMLVVAGVTAVAVALNHYSLQKHGQKSLQEGNNGVH